MMIANALCDTRLCPGSRMLSSFLDIAGGGGRLADSETVGCTCLLPLGGQDFGMER